MSPALFQDFPGLYTALAFVLGACVGSFLNVVIIRIPAGESIIRPGSHCACGKPIAWFDNIPILSWIILRGKARCCGRPFSIRYPAVELLSACLFLACWLRFPPALALCGWVFLASMIGATFIDLDHLVIPDVFSLGLGVAGVVLSFAVPSLHGQHGGFYALDGIRSGTAALEGLLIGSGLVFWIAMLASAILKKDAMGFGDVKFVGAIGAFCGWKGAVFSVFGGAAVGTLFLILAVSWGKLAPRKKAPVEGTEDSRSLEFGSHVPFGPMLAVAAALYFLVLRRPVDAWFSNLALLF